MEMTIERTIEIENISMTAGEKQTFDYPGSGPEVNSYEAHWVDYEKSYSWEKQKYITKKIKTPLTIDDLNLLGEKIEEYIVENYEPPGPDI